MASGQLGIGVRVWVGWTSSTTVKAKSNLCKLGVIIDGPHRSCCITTNVLENFWVIRLDNGFVGTAVERILFPIDEDGEESIENVKELETA